MAIEYVVDLECTPKSTLSYERWLELVRRRGQVEELRAAGAQDDTPIMVARSTPVGQREVLVLLRDLAAELTALAPLERSCFNCPARAALRAFGCQGSIAYPLSSDAEEWLMERLPADLDGTLGTLLTGAIGEFDYDGAPVRALRASGLLERTVPVVRRWGRRRISSDQILHMTFLVGDLELTHTTMLALFFAGPDFEVDEDDLEAALASGPSDARARLFAAVRGVPGDGVRAFVRALTVAASCGVGVRIDA